MEVLESMELKRPINRLVERAVGFKSHYPPHVNKTKQSTCKRHLGRDRFTYQIAVECVVMLTPHRRHLAECEHVAKGWNYTLCECPIWCDGTLNGKRFRRSLHTTNWERAVRRIGKLERGEDQDFIDSTNGRTLTSAVKAYIEDCVRRQLESSTIRSYRTCLDAFSGELLIGVVHVTDTHITKFLERKKTKPRTQAKEIEHLRAFCAFCVDRGWMEKNIAKRVKPPLIDDAATLPYTREEVDKLLAACGQIVGFSKLTNAEVRARCRALVMLLLYSGLRVSDVARLKRAALEPSGHLVLRTTKTNVPVKVLLKAEASAALRSLPAPGGNPTYFFWTGRQDAEHCAKSLWRTVNRIGQLADVHAHPHRFRDTFAVELITNGADMRTVQMLLGHESIKTTEKHYAHFVPAHQAILDSAVSTLDFTHAPNRPLLVSGLKHRRRNK